MAEIKIAVNKKLPIRVCRELRIEVQIIVPSAFSEFFTSSEDLKNFEY